ncbi:MULTISPECIES: hypothetical protein [Peribacillus]
MPIVAGACLDHWSGTDGYKVLFRVDDCWVDYGYNLAKSNERKTNRDFAPEERNESKLAKGKRVPE